MNRHQLGALLLNPELRLLVTTACAVTIPTASACPVFSATTVALITHATERPGAATRDQQKDFLLADGK